jgi:hypothetical protein
VPFDSMLDRDAAAIVIGLSGRRRCDFEEASVPIHNPAELADKQLALPTP